MRKFKKFYIEITNVCNLACSFCPITKRKAEFMDLVTFNNILDQIKPHTDFIYLHVKGEPLLHPNLPQFLDLCHEKGFKVNITTNGTLINKVKDNIMMKPALRQINFSLHSISGNEGLNRNQDYINNIILFVKEAVEKTDIYISLRLWNLEDTNSTVMERKHNQEILEILESEFNLPFTIQEKVTPGANVKIAPNVFLNQEFKFKWPDVNEIDKEDQGFCYGLRNQVAMLVDGTVVPCCLDGEGVINLGNIHKTNFTDIIENERSRNIYEGFSRREAVEELCKKCVYRKKL